jgi:hypothetical protein
MKLGKIRGPQMGRIQRPLTPADPAAEDGAGADPARLVGDGQGGPLDPGVDRDRQGSRPDRRDREAARGLRLRARRHQPGRADRQPADGTVVSPLNFRFGGKRAYRVRLGKDRSPRQSRHSIASAKWGSAALRSCSSGLRGGRLVKAAQAPREGEAQGTGDPARRRRQARRHLP